MRLGFPLDREACTRCLEPDGRDIGDPPPVRARAPWRAKSRRPQFMRIAVLLGLVAGQRYQPGSLASGVIVGSLPGGVAVGHQQCVCKRAIGHRSLDGSAAPSDDARQVFVPRQRTMASPDKGRAASPPATPGTCRLRSRATCDRAVSASISSPVIRQQRPLAAILPCDAAPRSINHKRGIRQQITRSMISFMESIV